MNGVRVSRVAWIHSPEDLVVSSGGDGSVGVKGGRHTSGDGVLGGLAGRSMGNDIGSPVARLGDVGRRENGGCGIRRQLRGGATRETVAGGVGPGGARGIRGADREAGDHAVGLAPLSTRGRYILGSLDGIIVPALGLPKMGGEGVSSIRRPGGNDRASGPGVNDLPVGWRVSWGRVGQLL